MRNTPKLPHHAAKNLCGLLLLSAVFMVGCQPKSEPEDAFAASSASSPTLTNSSTTRLEAQVTALPNLLPPCKGRSCPEFQVERLNSNYLFIDAQIDQAIVQSLQDMLDIGLLDQNQNQNNSVAVLSDAASGANATLAPQLLLQQQVKPFVDGFLKIDQEMKSLGTAHQLSLLIKPSVVQSKPPLVTVVLNSSNFLGGAHGAAAQRYFNFDLNQQQLLLLSDLIEPNKTAALQQQAYAVFSQWVLQNQLASNIEDYEHAWPFKLSDNFYLAPQGLILQYGEYEIGPYVVGLPRLVIPYNKLQGILKPQYLPKSKTAAVTSASALSVQKTS